MFILSNLDLCAALAEHADTALLRLARLLLVGAEQLDAHAIIEQGCAAIKQTLEGADRKQLV